VSRQHIGQEAERDDEFHDQDEERSPRFWVYALVSVVLAATGSGAAFAWHGYRGHDSELFTGALTAVPKAAPAQQAAAAQDALLRNLTDAQQRAAAVAQRNQELLQAQAADIKRLSDTVAQLATRVDSLSARYAQAAVPPAPKKPAAPKVAPQPAAPAPPSLAPEAKR
jgi:hypothetical protein